MRSPAGDATEGPTRCFFEEAAELNAIVTEIAAVPPPSPPEFACLRGSAQHSFCPSSAHPPIHPIHRLPIPVDKPCGVEGHEVQVFTITPPPISTLRPAIVPPLLIN